MSREGSAQQPDSHSDLDPDLVEEAGSDDDELARELELERQKLLAAAASTTNGNNDDDGDDSRSEGQEYLEDEDDDDDDIGGDGAQDEDDSADEWRPPEPAAKATRKSKRRRASSSSRESDQSVAPDLSDEDSAPASKKPKKAAKTKTRTAKSGETARKRRNEAVGSASDAEADEEADEYDSFDEEAERVQAEVEAAAAWADVRKRKEAAKSNSAVNASSTTAKPPSAPSFTAWLGKGPSASSSVQELAASLPMPTTCAAAQIVDRSSLFVGYVYPLTTTSSAYISALLSHLTRVVHPTVPVDLLPPQFANAPANKRGSSHDMYAYRVLELKRGRTGLAGPDDFSLQEDKEDDGERWGGDRVLRVAREEGASDVLVVVSRWYGGELLGPVRFEHIENAARAALEEHMAKEEVDEFRQRIQHLDRKIAKVKAGARGDVEEGGVPEYADLTIERAQRLWLARQKALDALMKRVASQDQQTSQPATSQQEEHQPSQPTTAQQEEHAGPNRTQGQDADLDLHPSLAGDPEEAAPVRLSEEPPASAPDEVHVKPEPSSSELLDASSGGDDSANVVGVKPEADTADALGANASHAQIKSEPVDAAAALRIKPDPDTVPPLNPSDSEEKPNTAGFTVKSEHTDDAATDLTGWDDL